MATIREIGVDCAINILEAELAFLNDRCRHLEEHLIQDSKIALCVEEKRILTTVDDDCDITHRLILDDNDICKSAIKHGLEVYKTRMAEITKAIDVLNGEMG